VKQVNGERFTRLIAYLPAQRPLALLDIGCGECLEGRALVEAGVRLTGIDQDEVAIREARRCLPEATFASGDATDPPVAWWGRFDAVLIRRPDLFAQPGRWQQVFAALPAYLTKSGTVIVTTVSAAEADLAERWLRESKILITTAEEAPIMDEARILVGYGVRETPPAGPKPAQAAPRISIIKWDADDAALGPICDMETGLCTDPDEEEIS